MSVRVGIVGLGGMGALHYRAWAGVDSAVVAAVCDVRDERLAGDWRGTAVNIDAGATDDQDLTEVATFGDFDRLIGEADVDAVDLCLPTFLHADFAVRALDAGKHVFCEKPMALSAGEAERMLDAAERNGRRLMVGHCLRFWPEYVLCREMVRTEAYGPVAGAVFRRTGGAPAWSWEQWMLQPDRSGGAAMDLHVHDTDAALWFFGRPRAVSSVGQDDGRGGVRYISTQLRYDDGPMVVAEGGWMRGEFPFNMTLTLHFEEATVHFDFAAKPTLTVCRNGDQPEHPEVKSDDAYRAELEYFAHCVAAGARPWRADPADSATAVRIVEAEVESVWSGKTIEVEA